MNLDSDQKAALAEMMDAYRLGQRRYTLTGAAGTGKTSLLKPLSEALDLEIHAGRKGEGGMRIAAYTNRAARVLRDKGLPAGTIHSFIGVSSGFDVVTCTDPALIAKYVRLQATIVGAATKTAIKKANRNFRQFLRDLNLGEKKFGLERDDNVFGKTDVVVLDEVSMINDDMGEIISDSCACLIVLGDPLQLGPVKGGLPYFLRGDADRELKNIYRQDSGKLAEFLQLLRDTQDVSILADIGNRFEPDVTIHRKTFPSDVLRQCDIAIARTHAEVYELNRRIRTLKMPGVAGRPQPGEPLIALDQNVALRVSKHDFVMLDGPAEHETTNTVSGTLFGKLARADGTPVGPRGAHMTMMFPDFYFRTHPGSSGQGEWKRIEKQLLFVKDEEGDGFLEGKLKLAFGHAVTDYASQGGEWGRVAVSFWPFKPKPRENATNVAMQNFRSLYTACSRARRKLDILI